MTSELCHTGATLNPNEEEKKNIHVGEPIMELVVQAKLPTKYGDFIIHGFQNKINGEHHVALTMGDVSDGEPVLSRVHSECLTGDCLGSSRCDCGDQFDAAMRAIAEAVSSTAIETRRLIIIMVYWLLFIAASNTLSMAR